MTMIKEVVFALSLLTLPSGASAAIFDGKPATAINIKGGGDAEGRAGYVPLGAPGATVCTRGSSEDFIESLQDHGYSQIVTLKGDEAVAFFADGKAELPKEVASIVFINPADPLRKGEVIFIGGYDKDGCYLGYAAWSVTSVTNALAAIKPAA